MKRNIYLMMLGVSLAAVPVFAEEEDDDFEIQSGAEQVVCITSGTLSVRSDNLSSVLFSVKRADVATSFQGWGDVTKTKTIDGKKYTFVKYQFPAYKGTNIGWVAESYIKPRSACAGLAPAPVPPPAPTPDPRTPTGTSLNDPRCCTFPLKGKPNISYESGTPSFGSNRSGGARKHAAADLYRSLNDSIVAVTAGTVIRNHYFFYQGTYALEVKHSGGFVVRYGEISSKVVTSANQAVAAGQTVGYMGKTTCCKPMLHFELYSGAKTGPLSVSGTKYQRRSDLLNPTSYLKSWQAKTFSE